MSRALRTAVCLSAALSGCQTLDRFDTSGVAAYCGTITSAQFVRTTEAKGGFSRELRLRLELDADNLSTFPGTLTTDDGASGPCAPKPTFDAARLRVTPEVLNDAISSMEFEEGQVENLVAWVDSTCRGPMLAVVSLYKNERVAVRLMKPGATGSAGAERDGFALFSMSRSKTGCGY